MNCVYVDIHTHHATESVTIRAVGVHPWRAACEPLPSEEEVAAAEAVGEIGLDFACEVDRAAQEVCFTAQLALAERLEKPVVLHCVRAFEEVMHSLRGRRLPAVIFHGFIGSKEQAERVLAAGYYLSFGERTLHSPKTIEALRHTPLERLFIETDEAQMPIEAIYASIAALRSATVEELRCATRQNYERIFQTDER